MTKNRQIPSVEFSLEVWIDLADIRRYIFDMFGENQVDAYLRKLAEGIQDIRVMLGIGHQHDEISNDLLQQRRHYSFQRRQVLLREIPHQVQLNPMILVNQHIATRPCPFRVNPAFGPFHRTEAGATSTLRPAALVGARPDSINCSAFTHSQGE